jgi:hypothetical protein
MRQKYRLKRNKQKMRHFFDAFFMCNCLFINQGMTTTLTLVTLSFRMTWSV